LLTAAGGGGASSLLLHAGAVSAVAAVNASAPAVNRR
jgi:hypothetical protein